MKPSTHQVATALKGLIQSAEDHLKCIRENVALTKGEGEPARLILSPKWSPKSTAENTLQEKFMPISTDKIMQLYQDESAAHVVALNADFDRLNDATAQEINDKHNMGYLSPKRPE